MVKHKRHHAIADALRKKIAERLTSGEAAHQIISGLQIAALVSAAMLVLGSVVSWTGIGQD
jgi:hypothetical protein